MSTSIPCIAPNVQLGFAMSASNVRSFHVQIEKAFALARVLERVERGLEPVNADQYQVLVTKLRAALSDDLPEPALNAILGAFPAAAEVYENLHYQVSGLSRSSLDQSVQAEMLTQKLLAGIAQASRRH